MTAINLLPRHHRENRRRATLRRRWVAAGICYCICMPVAGGLARMWNTVDDRSVRTEIARVSSDASQLEEHRTHLAAALTRLQGERALREAVNSPPDYTVLLEALSASVKDEGVLTALRWEVTPEGTSSPRTVPGEKTKTADPFAGPVRLRIELAGLVREQPAVGRVVSAIQVTGLFDDVRLMKSSREGFMAGSAFSFQIECIIRASRSGGHL